MGDPSSVRAHFDRVASSYNDDSDGKLWSVLRRRECAAVLDLLQPCAEEHVLDAGSGAGYYSAKLLQAGCRVTACDLSASMLEALKKRLPVETLQGDLARMTLEPRFGRVLCAGALEFVDDPPAAVRNLAGALSEEGPRVLVLMMPRSGLPSRIYRQFHRLHGMRINLFARPDVEALAAGAGMRLAAMHSVTFNWACRLERP